MKKLKFIGLMAIVIAFLSVGTMWFHDHHSDGISGLLLENIEALAAEESNSGYTFDCGEQEFLGECVLSCKHCAKIIEKRKGHFGGVRNITGNCPYCHEEL